MSTKNIVIAVIAFVAIAGGSYYYGAGLGNKSSSGTSRQVLGSSLKEFNVTMQNSRYRPSIITVNEGDRVVLNILNSDPIAHAFGIHQFGATIPGGHLVPGQTTRVEFVADSKTKVDAALCGGPSPEDKTDAHGEEFIVNVI